MLIAALKVCAFAWLFDIYSSVETIDVILYVWPIISKGQILRSEITKTEIPFFIITSVN